MYEGLLYIGFSQCLFAAFVMFTLPKRRLHERLLTWWLCVMAVKFLILIAKDFHADFFDSAFSDGLIPLTFGPFLYLYTRFLADEDLSFRWVDLKHFIPFVVYTFLYFTTFKGALSFTDDSFFQTDEYLWARVIFALSFIISIVVYAVLTFIQIRLFLQNFTEKFSFESGKRRIYWMKFIAILYVITHGLYIIAGALNMLAFKTIINIEYLSSIGLIVLAYAVSYYSVREKRKVRQSLLMHSGNRPELSKQFLAEPAETKGHIFDYGEQADPKEIKPLRPDLISNAAARKQIMEKEELEKNMDKLKKYMKQHKPYLNPELTMQDLAEKLNLPKSHLTFVLNTGLQCNFFNFINDYRVEEFKERSTHPDYQHLTLLAIAFDSGFNSKSSFHNIFKNMTGQTPSEYKRMVQEKGTEENS